MALYRKKPVVIEAEQWFPGKHVEGVCGCEINTLPWETPHVHTAHNGQAVGLSPGDWIIPEPDGEHFYPVKPDIFEATYEEVDNG